MIPLRMVAILFFAAVIGYVGLARAAFVMPTSAADAEACGLTPEDLAAMGELDASPTRAWLVSFVRQQEYLTAISLGLAVAFAGFAISTGRRLGAGVASGATLGSGVLVLGTLCLSCLAPALSVVGLGLVGLALAGVPKWVMAAATASLTGGGMLFLSRRVAGCPVSPPARGKEVSS